MRSVGFFGFILAPLFVLVGAAHGQPNPGYSLLYASIPVYHPTTGAMVSIMTVYEYVPTTHGNLEHYSPLLLNYDSHLTSPGNQKYGHAHALRDFPWAGRVGGGQPPSINVTKEMVDQAHLFDMPNHQLLASSSCGMNCHGLSMSKGFWVMTEALSGGASVVIANEYESGQAPAANRFFMKDTGPFPSYFHSYVGGFEQVPFGSLFIWVRTSVLEKFNTGPFLRSTSSASTGGTTLTRKHK